jgi:hypothetical protein
MEAFGRQRVSVEEKTCEIHPTAKVLNVPCRVFDIELPLRAVMLVGGQNEENPAPTEGPNIFIYPFRPN